MNEISAITPSFEVGTLLPVNEGQNLTVLYGRDTQFLLFCLLRLLIKWQTMYNIKEESLYKIVFKKEDKKDREVQGSGVLSNGTYAVNT